MARTLSGAMVQTAAVAFGAAVAAAERSRGSGSAEEEEEEESEESKEKEESEESKEEEESEEEEESTEEESGEEESEEEEGGEGGASKVKREEDDESAGDTDDTDEIAAKMKTKSQDIGRLRREQEKMTQEAKTLAKRLAEQIKERNALCSEFNQKAEKYHLLLLLLLLLRLQNPRLRGISCSRREGRSMRTRRGN